MPDEFTRVDSADAVGPGESCVYQLGEEQVAVFNVAGVRYAIADQCPHRGASLATGTVFQTKVRCPWHGWEIDLTSGRAVGRPGQAVARYEVSVEGDDLLIKKPKESDRAQNGIHHYLVRYGALGWVEHFGSIERIECSRRDRVLVHSRRGAEVADILAGPYDTAGTVAGSVDDQPTGEVVRRLTDEELTRIAAEGRQLNGRLTACRQLISERNVPLEIIDGERLFDGRSVVLYYLGSKSPAANLLIPALSRIVDAEVVLQPAIDVPPQEQGGCQSGGCGGCAH